MTLPLTPVYEGSSPQFMERMTLMARALPDIFGRVKELKLERAITSLNKLKFVERCERGSNVIAWYNPAEDQITVYPMAFCVGQRIDLAVYAGLGDRFWNLHFDSADRVTWKRLLVTPDKGLIRRLDNLLRTSKFICYQDLLRNFHSAVERLQVIHVCNALIHNSISPTQARTTSIYEYPATKDFCAQLRPYSLIPLVSAYSGIDDIRQFPYAFAQYCSRKGRFPITDPSTEAQMIELFKSVAIHE